MRIKITKQQNICCFTVAFRGDVLLGAATAGDRLAIVAGGGDDKVVMVVNSFDGHNL